jgi:hypothetical protein
MEYQDLHNILNKLVEFGEDKDELEYWKDIFPDLNEERQKEVYQLFEEELSKLAIV